MAHSQTAVFRRRVRDNLQDPPVVVGPETPVLDVVARMAERKASVAVLLDPTGQLSGILTEQDVTRRVAGRAVGTTPVVDLATKQVATVKCDQPLYEAVGIMRRLKLRHMPVLEQDGELAGMLFLHDALAAANPQLLESIDRLTHESTLDGLREVKAAQVELAASLFEDRVPAPDIQRLISSINNDIHRRVISLNVEAMVGEGWGAPPVDFAAIVMGSGGRGESFLFPDQDNGFILEDYPDEDHPRIDAWFIELASRMNDQLDHLGFPRCRGGIMAINPVWRKTLPQWQAQTSRWISRRSTIAMRLCDILFDFRCVYGRHQLAHDLGSHVLQTITANFGFLRDMFAIQAEHRAGLGWFGRLQRERKDRAHRGQVNLKYAGTLPLAEGVRLLALRHGIRPTSTLARIEALHDAGHLRHDEQDYLKGAFDHITGLQLRQQIKNYERGEPVGNWIEPEVLTLREMDMLKDAFRAINAFRDRLRVELTGELF